MIVVTGAAGFIGSCMVSKLNEQKYTDLVLVDDFSKTYKRANLNDKKYREKVERLQLFHWLEGREKDVQAIIHLGARTDTTEKDTSIFDALNFTYSQRIWYTCVNHQIPLIYASSAATYGAGDLGFDDDPKRLTLFHPLNPYGQSKHDFDLWANDQEAQPFFWAGLKFFNVYGPNEYHKGRMASVVFHAYNHIQERGYMKLFRSHRPEYKNGEQSRDFIYVKDVVSVILHILEQRKNSGIYNLGTGIARSFLDLGRAVFMHLGLQENIQFIDTPEDIRDTYQYFTQANVDRLRSHLYAAPFATLEEGVGDYVKNYLLPGRHY